jgi:hypothetical protein
MQHIEDVPTQTLLRELHKEVVALRKSLRVMDAGMGGLLLTHPGRLYLRQFGLGIVRGIGVFLGATVVVSFLVYLVGRLSLVDKALDALMQDILQRLPL